MSREAAGPLSPSFSKTVVLTGEAVGEHARPSERSQLDGIHSEHRSQRSAPRMNGQAWSAAFRTRHYLKVHTTAIVAAPTGKPPAGTN